MRRSARCASVVVASVLAACGTPTTPSDAGPDAPPLDARPADTSVDAPAPHDAVDVVADTTTMDAAPDAPSMDVADDAPMVDAPVADAPTVDAPLPDAPLVDAPTDAPPADAGHDAGAIYTGRAIDPTFGTGGFTTLNVGGGGPSLLWSVAVQADGHVLAFGRNEESVAVVRALANGTLDSAYGVGGLAFAPVGTPINVQNDVGYGAMVVTPDGHVVAFAHAFAYDTMGLDEAMVRFAPDGTLDPTFGTAGIVRSPGGRVGIPFGAALQADGRVVVAHDSSVDRYMPDGSADASFGTGGSVTSFFGAAAGTARPRAVVARPDGTIVVAGRAPSGPDTTVAVERLTASGAPDATFGGSGYLLDTGVVGSGPVGLIPSESLAVEADGTALVGAVRAAGTGGRAGVWRVHANGTVDTTYGTAGWALWPNFGLSLLSRLPVTGVAFESDGRAVYTGPLDGVSNTLTRFTTAGAVDTTFGTMGQDASGLKLAVAVQADDRIVTVGNPTLWRDDTTGHADSTFGVAGARAVPLGFSIDRGCAVAATPDGRIVVAGGSNGSNGFVARFTAAGALDTTFGTRGIAVIGGAGATGRSIAVDAAGRVLVGVGQQASGGGAAVVRFSATGAGDATFAHPSLALPQGAGVAATTYFAPDGTMWVTGIVVTHMDPSYFGVEHFDANGMPIASFGMSGAASVPLPGSFPQLGYGEVVVQPDGGVIAAAGNGSATVVVRFLASGAVDTSFGTAGTTSLMLAGAPIAMKLQPDGRVVVVTATTPFGGSGGGPRYLTLTRLLASGALDTGFGSGGSVRVVGAVTDMGSRDYQAPAGLVIQADGGILVAAAAGSSDGLSETATLYRFNASGALDATFGSAGALALPLSRRSASLHGLTVVPDGSVLVVGRAWTDTGGSDLALARLR